MTNSSGESAAREQVVLAKALAEACARFDGTTLSSWRDYTDDTLLPLIARHYAARAREVQEVSVPLGLISRLELEWEKDPHSDEFVEALTDLTELAAAAKGETDSVAAQGEQHD